MEMSPALGEASKDVNSYKCCLLIVTCNPDKREFNVFKQLSIRTDLKVVYGQLYGFIL